MSCFHPPHRPIFEVDPPSTALGALDLLRFYYYGGMAFVGLKRYSDALDFFRTVRPLIDFHLRLGQAGDVSGPRGMKGRVDSASHMSQVCDGQNTCEGVLMTSLTSSPIPFV